MVDCVDSLQCLLLALAFKHNWTTASLFCPQWFHFLFSQSTQTVVFEIGGHKQFYMVISHVNHPQPLTHAVLCSQVTKCWCHTGTSYPGREPGLCLLKCK